MPRSKKKKGGRGKPQQPQQPLLYGERWKDIKITPDVIRFERDDPEILALFGPERTDLGIQFVFGDGKGLGVHTTQQPLRDFLETAERSEPQKWDALIQTLYRGLTEADRAAAISPPCIQGRSVASLSQERMLAGVKTQWPEVSSEDLFESPAVFAGRLIQATFPGDASGPVEVSAMFVEYCKKWGERPPGFVILDDSIISEEESAMFPVVESGCS